MILFKCINFIQIQSHIQKPVIELDEKSLIYIYWYDLIHFFVFKRGFFLLNKNFILLLSKIVKNNF